MTTQAGWSEIDITPPLGIAMGGRGPRFTPGATILDPLFAQATIIKDYSGNKLIFISLDLILLGSDLGDRIRLAVAAVTGANPMSVILNCSHTHSGPMTHHMDSGCDISKSPQLVQYERELIVRIQRVARQAMNDLKPAKLSWKIATSDVGINRRLPDKNGKALMQPNPQGSYNKEVWVLEIQCENSRAVLFSYGCHPVIVYGRVWDGISAEWPGLAREKIKKALDDVSHAQFFQGLAGDVRPRSVADLENQKFIKPTTQEHVEKSASDMASAVETALQSEGDNFIPELGAIDGYALFECETNETETLEYWQKRINDEDELTRNKARYWAFRHENGAAPLSASPWPIGLVKLSKNHYVAWIAGEPLSGWLEILKNNFAGKKVWALGYTKVSSGYLATDKDLPFDGYEVLRSRAGKGKLKAGVDKIIIDAFTKLEKHIVE